MNLRTMLLGLSVALVSCDSSVTYTSGSHEATKEHAREEMLQAGENLHVIQRAVYEGGWSQVNGYPESEIALKRARDRFDTAEKAWAATP